ncbi:MAG: hypothetical protein H6613_05880 [Ignavibacteriales bacterium]|nr:hypothetical protein [Ignavibacteriales bacterium]
MNQLKNNLKELLQRSSKHCNYQVLPTSLRNFVDIEDLAINSRYEVERLEYLLKHIDPRGKSILDIGGNTGYFSFELLEKGASKVIFYEGNNAHADFVTEASKLIAKENLIDVQNEYFQFSKEQYRIQTDIVLFTKCFYTTLVMILEIKKFQ